MWAEEVALTRIVGRHFIVSDRRNDAHQVWPHVKQPRVAPAGDSDASLLDALAVGLKPAAKKVKKVGGGKLVLPSLEIPAIHITGRDDSASSRRSSSVRPDSDDEEPPPPQATA